MNAINEEAKLTEAQLGRAASLGFTVRLFSSQHAGCAVQTRQLWGGEERDRDSREERGTREENSTNSLEAGPLVSRRRLQAVRHLRVCAAAAP